MKKEDSITSGEGKKYILDLRKLRVGDIILEAGNTKYISESIKRVTKSKYSHAILYVGDSVIHADSGGVFSKNPQRMLVDSEDTYKVLRLNDNVDFQVLRSIVDNARLKIGSLYSTAEAISSVIKSNSNTTARTKMQFCSRLVAQTYHSAGLPLVRNSDYCSPEDLNKSDQLHEVKDCTRIASVDEIKFSTTDDPNLLNQEETFKWLKKCRKLYSKENIDIQSASDLDNELIKNREHDKRICKYIESTKYLHLYNVDRKINPYRYKEDLFFLRMDLVSDDKNEMINSEISLNEIELDRHSKNLINCRTNYKQNKLKYYKINMKLYRNILLEVKHRVFIINKYLEAYPDPFFEKRVSEINISLSKLLK